MRSATITGDSDDIAVFLVDGECTILDFSDVNLEEAVTITNVENEKDEVTILEEDQADGPYGILIGVQMSDPTFQTVFQKEPLTAQLSEK